MLIKITDESPWKLFIQVGVKEYRYIIQFKDQTHNGEWVSSYTKALGTGLLEFKNCQKEAQNQELIHE